MDSKRTAKAIIAHGLGVSQDEPERPFFADRPTESGPRGFLSPIERSAYRAAWRIDREKVPEVLDSLACASTRPARRIDHIARIIAEECGR